VQLPVADVLRDRAVDQQREVPPAPVAVERELLDEDAHDREERTVAQAGGDEQQHEGRAEDARCPAGDESQHGGDLHQRTEQLEDEVEG
jgi:hypothetical protein